MQIKKIYKNIKPDLLFDELKDLIIKQGAEVTGSKMVTYSLPEDSSSFISRGTLTFKVPGKTDKESIIGHIVGSAKGETKLLMDIDDSLFSKEKVASFQDNLEFLLGSYEVKTG